MTAAAKVLAAIVAGGAGRRLGGVCKPLLRVGGVRIVDRQLQALGAVFDRVVVVAPDSAPFADVGVAVVRDRVALGSGPLAGIRVIELPNIGPVQFAGMLLADMGAEVLRLDRATDVATGSSVAGFVSPYSVIDRGRCSVGIDLKHAQGPDVVLRLCEQADVLLEGKADAVLAASIFHFGTYTVGDVKRFLAEKQIPVRL